MNESSTLSPDPESVTTLQQAANAWNGKLTDAENKLTDIQREIDDLAYELYEIGEEDRQAIEAMLGQKSDDEDAEDEVDEATVAANTPELVSELLDYAVGCAFGRFDVRCATGEKPEPPEPDPFDPLPVCSPGMLQNSEGLPAEKKDVPADYPMRISWPGILVNDPGHPEDVLSRVRDVLGVIWGEHADAIEEEACKTLKSQKLRDYLNTPTKYFANHLKRWSKSRRQAPLYWPLSTASGSYTLWVYYHRLDDQLLYKAINEFVEPKLESVGKDLEALRTGERQDSKKLEELSDLELELKDFREELLRLAPIWKPNLNDGVLITASPLYKLFLHKPWQKKLKETWTKLKKGDFDWAHIALSYEPERVREKCESDKSLAIAHDLEDLFQE
jgi:hypothetical protein